mmetsp:Transcript_10028/g.9956  ORF Transcript_10028/g.9956 Transcript_10028/m.9956 type:complete len:225 (-) Transcript_10028:1348-2022(-)
MSCFYEGCKNKPEMFCACSSSEVILCGSHMQDHIKDSKEAKHPFESLYRKPDPALKQFIINQIDNKIKALDEQKSHEIEEAVKIFKETQMKLEESLLKINKEISSQKKVKLEIMATEEISKLHPQPILAVFDSYNEEYTKSIVEQSIENQCIPSIPAQIDYSSFNLLHLLSNHSMSVNSVAYSPSGSHLASCSSDRSIKIWDLSTYKVSKEIRGHNKNDILSIS